VPLIGDKKEGKFRSYGKKDENSGKIASMD
jgi:hypothetical protein